MSTPRIAAAPQTRATKKPAVRTPKLAIVPDGRVLLTQAISPAELERRVAPEQQRSYRSARRPLPRAVVAVSLYSGLTALFVAAATLSVLALVRF